MSNSLSLISAAKTALMEAKSIQDVVGIRDKAEAFRVYAKSQRESLEVMNQASELKLRAERAAGALLANMELNSVSKLKSNTMLLSDLGITKMQSSRWQTEAEIDEESFEKFVRNCNEAGIELTQAALLRAQKKVSRENDIANQKKDIESGNVKLPDGLFEVVSIDPPWAYGRKYDPESSRVANPYPEMSQEELLELDPPFADNCVLFLWTTHAFIWDAKELCDNWGFTYKANLVWDKEKIGMGSWLRMQCEFCLVCIKGKPLWDNTTWRDVIREPRREHSRKPDTFYKMVESITAGRRLDYFSREQREGWETFGNETTKF